MEVTQDAPDVVWAQASGLSTFRSCLNKQVVLPDADGVMALSRCCFFDDAAWLGGEDQRMAHPDISVEAAEALGCQSLRYQVQVPAHISHVPSATRCIPSPPCMSDPDDTL